MAFNAEQRKISTILSGDWQYTIPRYQRKYVWEEKQWRELLDDLKYCLENENISSDQDWTHFLGSFVFEKNQKDNKLVKQCFNFFYTHFSEIIDFAEQRIIELSRIKDKILALDVIEILATNQQESYNIFEILNARGVDLQQHELIKNYGHQYCCRLNRRHHSAGGSYWSGCF